MPQGKYKSGEVIELTYQAVGAESGLEDVTMEIFDETGAKDIANFPDVVMEEIGNSGRYSGQFIPDDDGKWRAMIDSVTKPGKIVKDFDVTGHNLASVGAEVKTSKIKLDSVEAKVDQTDNKVDLITVALNAVDTKVDNIVASQSGPMVG